MKPFSILYVEDEEKTFDAWADWFMSLDHRSFDDRTSSTTLDRAASQAAANAAVDRAIADGIPYRIVFLDLRYPEYDGEEPRDSDYTGLKWLPDLRAKLPNALILVYTAHANADYLSLVRQALTRGANDFLPKGTPWEVIKLRISQAWDGLRKDMERRNVQKKATFLLRSHWTRAQLLPIIRSIDDHLARVSEIADDARWLGPTGIRLGEALLHAGKDLTRSVDEVVNDPGKLSRHEATEDFRSWLEENLSWVDLIFAEHRIRLQWSAAKVPLHSYLADLSVVMHELLQNALCGIVSRSAEGDRRIEISIEQSDGAVVVTIEDNGCGIDTKTLASGKIYELGHSEWPPHVKALFEHQGLGLNFVRQIINQIGGKILIENVGGSERRGLRVELTIPSIPQEVAPE